MPNVRNIKDVELKPCPFCGSSARALYIDDYRYHTALVGCSKCWCEIEKTLGRYEQSDIKDAVKKWNTRVGSEK